MSGQIATDRVRALDMMRAGRFDLAAPLLVSVLARTPPDAETLRLCGIALLRGGDPLRALPYLARARRLDARDGGAALWHGLALQAADRPSEAVEAFTAAARLQPQDPGPPLHLSRALFALNRLPAALEAAERAVAAAPSLPEARHALLLARVRLAEDAKAPGGTIADLATALGDCCLRMDRVRDARAAFSYALSLRPDDPDAGTGLALAEHLSGEPAAALERLRTVVRDRSDLAAPRLWLSSLTGQDGDWSAALALLDGRLPANQADRAWWMVRRASALLALGRTAEARELLFPVEASGPGGLAADWQRLLLRRREGNAVPTRMLREIAQAAADRNAAPLDDRINIHFGLASIHHAAARHDEAFAHWRSGHALMRDAQPFSRDTHAALLRAAMASAPRSGSDPSRVHDTGPDSGQNAVFIVGLPRTGTTLTEHILSAHRDIHGAGERMAVRDALRRLSGTAATEDALIRAASLGENELAEARADFLRDLHALAPDARLVLDKMPDNLLLLGVVARLLPGARVIFCTRDLRDVGFSIFRHRFLGHHPYAHDLSDLGWFMARAEELLRHWLQTLPLRMTVIDHSDWVERFDETLIRTLDFLDLPFDESCRRFHEQERDSRTASRDQIRRPINADGIGRWKTYAGALEPMIRELSPR
ncbi:tetratricopeptide repeat-containing sulfotransferase family protein [Rhizosaccharibacter radicis]|uniref:Sulfotransferase n=1 Tax=Rhizosaccharibacter radicis TaxID=2782605 RepID=A0ABT1W336_9PROT|nr:sulfotransferase [Acetobacteraceae bacterium KSS12]